ncbi:hypothetical protein FBPa19_0031 [Pseudomonas phage vB_PaeP_FBPa19]|uniref:Uncharacterized protein n=1 Tax=Pseudomonas phage vB_PaeP_FBPa42 TaxID=3231240 RepID=A0AAU8KVD1_9VIRU|nr:hypothetical protein FBPa19_0031 [Pseudomonas phage vB_PaeP_FBPa19]
MIGLPASVMSIRRRARARMRAERRDAVVDAAIAALPTIERNRFLNDESAALYEAVRELLAVQ